MKEFQELMEVIHRLWHFVSHEHSVELIKWDL